MTLEDPTFLGPLKETHWPRAPTSRKETCSVVLRRPSQGSYRECGPQNKSATHVHCEEEKMRNKKMYVTILKSAYRTTTERDTGTIR